MVGLGDMLATPEDLASLLERDDVEVYKSTMMIECATGVIQALCGQRITQVVGDQITIPVTGCDQWLELPEHPVTAVTLVKVGPTTVADWTLSGGRLWRPSGWRSTMVVYPNQPTTVTVTYTHGYPPGDQRLQLARNAVLALVRTAYGNPTGATQVRIDDYSAMWANVNTAMEASPFLAQALRRAYGRTPVSAVMSR